MDILNQIVEKLTKEEIRNFKLFYGPNHAKGERKDLLLFNYVRSSGNKFDEDKAISKLDYAGASKGNYYRLKNRLVEDIGDSLTLLHTHKQELYELLQFIQLFHIYYSKNLYKTCLFYLRKAERLATSIENYELLEIVYSNFIRLAANMIEIEPAGYIEKREKNAVVVANLREMDDILATLSYRLKISQNYGANDQELLKKLQAKVRDIGRQTTSGFGKNLEARIYSALSQVFLQQMNYTALEKLVKDTYKKFEKENWFDKSNHLLKLQMLTYAANALYKNHKYGESLEYAEKLGGEINQFNKLHYDTYVFFYYNIKVLNYATLEPLKAIKALDELEQEMRRKKSTYYDFFIYLNRAGLLYDIARYKESLKNLVRLYVSDGYAKADKAFKMKIEVAELIITFESGDLETLTYRLEQVKKTFANLLKQQQFKRNNEMIKLLEMMAASADYKHDADVQKKIKALLKIKASENDEVSDILIYKGWLQRKLEQARR